MIRRKRVVATVGLVAAALALALAGAGASMALGGGNSDRAFRVPAGPADLTKIKHAAPLVLSSRPAIDRYLRSIHVNPKTVVFQRGALNYAGPNCPGAQWNCTRAHRVVQIASRLASRSLQAENNFECSPAALASSPPTNCVIVQIPLGTDPTNQNAKCKIQAKDSPADLTCNITQTNGTGGSNDADVDMKIEDNDGSTQSGNETAMITQSAMGGGNNTANVNMDIKLKTNDGTTQTQNGYQSLELIQHAVNGNNSTKLDQSQDLNAKLKKTASGVQNQNTIPNATDDPCDGAVDNANSCVQYDQLTTFGNNTMNVKQHHNLDGWAKNSDAAAQNQGCPSFPGNKVCGIEEVGTQDAPNGTNTANVNQEGKYKLDGPSGSTTQIQDPRFGGALSQQIGSANDRFTIRQSAELKGGDEQSHDNVVSDSSTGVVDAMSKIVTDTRNSTVRCMGSSCDYEQSCSTPSESTFGFSAYYEGTAVGCPADQTVTSTTFTD